MSLLDIFFPKRCIQCRTAGSYLCAACFTYISFADTMICIVCQRNAVGGLTHPRCKTAYSIDGVFPSLVYKGVVKKLLYTFKYPPHLTDLRSQLAELLYEGLIQKEQFYNLLASQSVLVPIPLHKTKLRKRGYNQAHILAKALGQKVQLPVLDCLERRKNTKTQVGLTKEQRASNISGAFNIKPQFEHPLRHIEQVFLIDDVTTTGATLREAAKLLKRAGVKKVWGITLAHGE